MIMKLKPIFKETLWGGDRLKTVFNLDIPSDKTGEVWGISGLKDNANEIINTEYAGKTLHDLWQNHRHLFGDKTGDYFPILVKLIDANQDLSIQVHPDDFQARKHGSLGKTECWYILDCDADTEIIIGHEATSKAMIRQAIEQDTVLDIVNHHRIRPGDFFFIEAGTLHAIKAGTLLLEVQQSSDITYRFYDYGRSQNGKTRPLHIDEALDVVKVPDNDVKTTLDRKYFNLEMLDSTETKRRKAHRHGDFITVLAGSGSLSETPAQKGMFFFVPAKTTYRLRGDLKLAVATII